MRLLVPLLAVAAASAAIVPAPRRIATSAGELKLPSVLRVRVSPDTPANRFAFSTLAPLTISISPTYTDALIEARVTNTGAPESYKLQVTASGIRIDGPDEAGLYYAVQTLRQLINDRRSLPLVTISDAPALRYRALSIDISRGPVLTEAQLQSIVRRMAGLKFNQLSLYLEHIYPYRHSPLVAPSGTGIDGPMLRRLSEFAARHHIDLVPQQQTFGHLHHLLKVERYAKLSDTPHGSVLTPESDAAYQWIDAAARELAGVLPGPFFHIGSDETFSIAPDAYLRHVQHVGQMLAPLGRRLMMWGDMALGHPEMIPNLPKGIVAMTWEYSAKPDYTAQIEPFRKAGIDVFVCPGLSNWQRIVPDTDTALDNIGQFAVDGVRLGAIGMMATHWNDEGGSLFNANWFAIEYAAAAAWQGTKPDKEAWYREAPVIARFARANKLLNNAEALFWADPFSKTGARNIAKALPVASELRLIAEQNLIDLAAKPDIYLELAARRLDYLGMKIQFAAHIGERYRKALAIRDDARARRLELRRIASNNGYTEDLRTAILEIKQLARAAWLEENQPYWLDNLMVKYDAEALYWQQKSNLFRGLIGEELPDPAALGLTLPE